MLRWILLILLPISIVCAKERSSSYPYLAGDTWRFFCDWELSIYSTFDPAKVQLGDTIFCEHDSLSKFLESYLPYIQNKFILVTANSEQGGDDPLPGIHRPILESPMVYRWLVQNIDCEPTDKLIPIPIGLANTVWSHGDVSLLDFYIPNSLEKRIESKLFLSYLNFSTSTNIASRYPCRKYFENCPFCRKENPKPFSEYLHDLSDTIFVVSPPGNGLDCHRTWEALLMGCYPIVKSTTLNPLYKDLPIVIIDTWEEVTEEFLLRKIQEFEGMEWSREKLYAPYWFDRVMEMQDELVTGHHIHFITGCQRLISKYSLNEGLKFREEAKMTYPLIENYLVQSVEFGFMQGLDVHYDDKGILISPPVLRYVKIACDILNQYGDSLREMKIAEIGGKDGILCKILYDISGFSSYTCYDRPPFLLSKAAFLNKNGITNVNFISTLKAGEPEIYDLVISQDGFLEMIPEDQLLLARTVMAPALHGLVSFGSKSTAWGIPVGEFLNIIQNAIVDGNGVVRW